MRPIGHSSAARRLPLAGQASAGSYCPGQRSSRLVAKKIAKQLKSRLGEGAGDKPLNVNRTSADNLLAYRLLEAGLAR